MDDQMVPDVFPRDHGIVGSETHPTTTIKVADYTTTTAEVADTTTTATAKAANTATITVYLLSVRGQGRAKGT